MKKSILVFLSFLLCVSCLCSCGLKSVLKPKITGIMLSSTACEVTEDETIELKATIFPENADPADIIWKSADETIATVSNGIVTGVAKGQTTISASTADGVVATCTVTVKLALPDFGAMYGGYDEEVWCEIAEDGTWMEIDTNPFDIDDYYGYSDARVLIKRVLEDLGFASSVYNKMQTTNALQGRQSAECEVATVSWTYHPDNGLQAMFEVKKDK